MIELGLLILPPVAVCLVAPADWLDLVERAYLVRTPAWGLGRGLLLISMLPAMALALVRSGVLSPPELRSRIDGPRAWVGVSVLTAVAGWAHLGFSPLGVLVSVVGLGFLLLPLRIVRAADIHPLGALLSCAAT